jgi:tetratricopeptide (TPR) repeat protein
MLALALSSSLSGGAARAEPPSAAERAERLIAQGAALERAGDPTSAVAFYRDAVAAAPRDPRGYMALGSAYLALEETARAHEAFELGTRASTGSEALWLGLAEAQQRSRQDEGARATLRALLAQFPDSSAGLERLYALSSSAGRWLEALAATRALARLAEARADARSRGAERSARTSDSRAVSAPQTAERESSELRTRAHALERLLGAAERVHARTCPAPSAVLAALGRCEAAEAHAAADAPTHRRRPVRGQH